MISVLAASCVILRVLASGCADIGAKTQVLDFGTAFSASAEEQQAIDWFKMKYGDPVTNGGPAKFVEPLITTGLTEKKMPVNKVTVFPVDDNNCGKCGRVYSLPNSLAICAGENEDGRCEVEYCTGGYLNTNGIHEGGCEVPPSR